MNDRADRDLDNIHSILAGLVKLICPWVRLFEAPAEPLPGADPVTLEHLRVRAKSFIPGDPLPEDCDGWCADDLQCQWPYDPHCRRHPRHCRICGTSDNLMDERDRCWDCNDELQRERAIEDRANERGQRY